MAFLNDIRRWFPRRHHAVTLDLRTTQAAGLMDETADHANGAETENPVARNGHDDDDKDARPSSRVPRIFRLPGAPRHRSQSELQQLREDVAELARGLTDHLEAQFDRTTRLLEIIERFPRALEMLPEISRQDATLFELLSEHLNSARTREESLMKTIERLEASSQRQGEGLGLIHRQSECTTQAVAQVADNLIRVETALRELSDSQTQTGKALETITRTGEKREQRFLAALDQTRTWIIVGITACAVTSLVALAVALFG